jgi:UDP-glucose 4-epimerase
MPADDPRLALVSGAGGFIGARLTAALVARGWRVRAFVREGRRAALPSAVEIATGDIRDAAAVAACARGADVVFHLAGKAHDLAEWHDTGEHHDVTVGGTSNVLAGAAAAGVTRVVFFSSLAVYGAWSDRVRDEEDECRPVTPYGVAKLAAERLLFERGPRAGVAVVTLRPAMVYGPGCKGNLPRMIRMIDRGWFPPLPKTGARRSLLHVNNLVDAAILAADHRAAAGRTYIVTDARAYSAREMQTLIARALGRPLPRWSVPPASLRAVAALGDLVGRVRGRRAPFDSEALDRLIAPAEFSSARIERELGYAPVPTFESAIPDVVAEFRHT